MKRQIALMVAATLVASVGSTAESMRCGTRVVVDGDPKAKVAALCGKPTSTEQRTVYRSGLPRQRVGVDARFRQSVSDRELVIHDRSLVEVKVDVWLYNHGRSRLLREVVFEDNRVVEVNVLGRGY